MEDNIMTTALLNQFKIEVDNNVTLTVDTANKNNDTVNININYDDFKRTVLTVPALDILTLDEESTWELVCKAVSSFKKSDFEIPLTHIQKTNHYICKSGEACSWEDDYYTLTDKQYKRTAQLVYTQFNSKREMSEQTKIISALVEKTFGIWASDPDICYLNHKVIDELKKQKNVNYYSELVLSSEDLINYYKEDLELIKKALKRSYSSYTNMVGWLSLAGWYDDEDYTEFK